MKRKTYHAPMIYTIVVEAQNILVLSDGDETTAPVDPTKEVDAGNALSNQRGIWSGLEQSRSLW